MVLFRVTQLTELPADVQSCPQTETWQDSPLQVSAKELLRWAHTLKSSGPPSPLLPHCLAAIFCEQFNQTKVMPFMPGAV